MRGGGAEAMHNFMTVPRYVPFYSWSDLNGPGGRLGSAWRRRGRAIACDGLHGEPDRIGAGGSEDKVLQNLRPVFLRSVKMGECHERVSADEPSIRSQL